MSNAAFDEGVLLVDDDNDIIELEKNQLGNLGIKIFTASSGAEGLEILKREKIFLIIADFRMPEMNGIEFSKKAHEEKPSLPIVLFSGFADKETVILAIREGITDVLEKPKDFSKIADVIKKHRDKRIAEIKSDQEEMLALRSIFITEVQDILSDVDKWILRLEEEPLDSIVVDTVFRKIHTIKGSAGAFSGAQMISKVAHMHENVLSKLRSHTLSPNALLIDTLLKGADLIKGLVSDFDTGIESKIDLEQLEQNLQNACNNTTSSTPAPTEAETKKTTETPNATANVTNNTKQNTRETEGEDDSILVNNEKLVQFMDLSGELIVFKNTMQVFLRQLIAEPQNLPFRQGMEDFNHSLEKISEQFQRHIMEIRKVELANAFGKFQRVMRQLSNELGKKIDFKMEGTKLGVDKSIAKALAASLIHVVRNAADHGVEMPQDRVAAGKSETGKITLSCSQVGDYIFIKVTDDGKGVVREKVIEKAIKNNLISAEESRYLKDEEVNNLLFLPGFSTAEKVSNVSGRGVGMDVVRTEILKFHGSVKLESTPNQGMSVHISLPIPKTVMVENAVLARSGEVLFAIPLTAIDGIVSLNEVSETNINKIRTCQHKNRTIPIGSYGELIHRCGIEVDKTAETIAQNKDSLVLILTHKNDYLGLLVDTIVEQQEAVIRPFDDIIKNIPGFKGTSILNNDRVAFVINAEDMLSLVKLGNANAGV